MNTTDKMTGAELQTLREACGLSRDELGELCDVAARTVKHWEHGRAGVPADVAALVLRLDAEIDNGAWSALIEARSRYGSAATALNDPPMLWPGFVLVRARSAGDIRALAGNGVYSGKHAPGVTWPALGGPIARLALMLDMQRDKRGNRWPVPRVVWFDPTDYAAWLQAQGSDHSGDQLQAWALTQVRAQAIPHRADQPPA